MMEEKSVELTPEGYKKLEERLEYLKTHQRREVADRIRQAKEFGEIGENSEYEDAKSEQAFIEGEIMRLESVLRNARVLDRKDVRTSIVGIGSKVLILNTRTKKEQEYEIVGSSEADPSDGKISNLSPVGKALCGHKKGEEVSVVTPKGKIKYQILKIRKAKK
ncbi:MAG: transcription elongation factor GreA [Candidatus Eremiobacteraeota bacterium]|nr:transcription elongation factor GreA [Candidatus Eremiobacteraeota bacterium]